MSAMAPPPPADLGYSATVADLYASMPGAGRPPDSGGWAVGEARDALSGTHVRWYLRAEAGRIAAARYEVRGCPHTMAAAAVIAAALPGQPAGATRIDVAAVAASLEAPAEKLGRLFVIEDAVRDAALLLAGPHP
jgi:NifU-like protein involved in Fe-S cluster formation